MTGKTASPIKPSIFTPLPLGAIQPRGWLKDQLRVQADGLSGHLDEFWPDVADSKWIGGKAEGWERGPYWLDGFVPLAVLTGDERLMAKARRWVDYIVAHQHADGWLGAADEGGTQPGTGVPRKRDPWPLFIVFKAFAQWQEATGDARVIPTLLRAADAIGAQLDQYPLESWAKMRWVDLAVGLLWLAERAPEASDRLFALARKAATQGYDWRAHYAHFVYTGKQPKWTLENHVVNHAMSLKEAAIRARLGPEGGTAEEALSEIATLDRYHGQVTGVFTGDESLAGDSPSQGTELCSVVEYLFSLEQLVAAFGRPEFGDRMERIAYNALPATFTDDMCAHQYVQQVNQVVCKLAPDGERIYTNNGPDANLFGLEPHFGCCTANMHQGWPKFASHLWLRTAEGGVAAVAYAPCHVDAGNGLILDVSTEYPFREKVQITIHAPAATAEIPLLLRIPIWAKNATVVVNGGKAEKAAAGKYHTIKRKWSDGDTVALTFPMAVRLEERAGTGARSVLRGPLVFGLHIGTDFRRLKGTPPYHDREVFPTTPWNYALASTSPANFVVSEAPITKTPFSAENPPVTIQVPVRSVPAWMIEQNAAGPVPRAPKTEGNEVRVTLAPFGATRLRVAEFPLA